MNTKLTAITVALILSGCASQPNVSNTISTSINPVIEDAVCTEMTAKYNREYPFNPEEILSEISSSYSCNSKSITRTFKYSETVAKDDDEFHTLAPLVIAEKYQDQLCMESDDITTTINVIDLNGNKVGSLHHNSYVNCSYNYYSNLYEEKEAFFQKQEKLDSCRGFVESLGENKKSKLLFGNKQEMFDCDSGTMIARYEVTHPRLTSYYYNEWLQDRLEQQVKNTADSRCVNMNKELKSKLSNKLGIENYSSRIYQHNRLISTYTVNLETCK